MPLNSRPDGTLPPIGDIPLLLVAPERVIELAPSGISVGLITLGAWLISRVPRLPDSFGGHSAYLIRIPYDLDLEPGGTSPRRLEISFTFATDGVSVHDALPQRATGRAEQSTYVLNGQLTFSRQDDIVIDRLMSDISLPEGSPGSQLLGTGTSTIRCRLSGTARTPLRAGPHVCWIVLLVPSDLPEVRVIAAASFTLPDSHERDLREMTLPDAFTVALPGDHRPAVAHRAATGKRVFVSYVHESATHKADVKTLSDLLRAEGDVTVILDQDEPAHRQDWQRWMTIGISRSDYVLVVASPVYRAVGLYETANVTRRGIDAEYRLLASLLAEDYPRWLRKILPVVLPGRAVSEIPVLFQPYDADYYLIGSLTPDGVAGLLKTISLELPP
jgi:hypothetical protein